MTPSARYQCIPLEQVTEICRFGHVVLLSVHCVLNIIM